MTTTRAPDAPGPSLIERVCHNLTARCRIGADRLLVAVSGGSDSVALLRLLVEAQPQFGYELIVAHFDHRLRPDSEADARFVRDLAACLSLEAHFGAWDSPRHVEAAARSARQQFLQQTARRLGCSAIVLGHQLDDQIETVLMRLGRGSGPRGLAGMRWRRRAPIDIVRPLLSCGRDELVAYLRHLGQPWCDDASNIDLSKTRNRVRLLVLPALDAALGAGWRERWSPALEDQQEVTAWMRRTAERILSRARRRAPGAPAARLQVLELAPLRRLAEPLRRAALQHWLDPKGTLGLRRLHLIGASNLVRNGQTGQRIDLPGPVILRIEADTLVGEFAGMSTSATGRQCGTTTRTEATEPPAYTLQILPIDTSAAVQGMTVKEPATPPIWYPGNVATVVCADRTSPPFVVRTGSPGEKVRLLGAPGTRRLTRILQDKRVPPRLRPGWPVVADSQGIVWIPGAGVAERCRVDASSADAVRLRLLDAPRRPVRLAEVHDET